MYRDKRIQVADIVLNNPLYKDMGIQMVELNKQSHELKMKAEAYQYIRDFIRDKILSYDDALNRIEIYTVLFNQLLKDCETISDCTNMENLD